MIYTHAFLSSDYVRGCPLNSPWVASHIRIPNMLPWDALGDMSVQSRKTLLAGCIRCNLEWLGRQAVRANMMVVREGGMNIVERMIVELKNELATVEHKEGSI